MAQGVFLFFSSLFGAAQTFSYLIFFNKQKDSNLRETEKAKPFEAVGDI